MCSTPGAQHFKIDTLFTVSTYQCGKGSLLSSREISLKVICEKVKFQTMIFAFVIVMNRHTCKSFNKILNDVQPEDNVEITTT